MVEQKHKQTDKRTNLQRPAKTTYLTFYLERDCHSNTGFDHLMEDFYYATCANCAKIREMVAIIACPLENRILQADAKLMIEGDQVRYSESTAMTLLNRMSPGESALPAAGAHLGFLDRKVPWRSCH